MADNYIVIVSKPEDLNTLILGMNNIKKNLNPKKIIIISNKEAKKLFTNNNDVLFYDENEIVEGMTYGEVKKLILEKGGDVKYTGWYFQQFLKMGFSRVFNKNPYIVWDADTLPLKEINFIDNGKYIFYVKNEYHKPYFDTIKILLNLKKIKKESFISEKMIIIPKYMNQLLDQIESNNCIQGDLFYEKVINSITQKDINNAGFSEFETYGTFMENKYQDIYVEKEINTLRGGSLVFGNNIDGNLIEWLNKTTIIDTISFERSQKGSKLCSIVSSKAVQKIISPDIILKMYLKRYPSLIY